VVTGRYGTIGEVFYVEEDFWPLNTTLYVRDFKGNSPRYCYFLLETINFDTYSDKAAVPGINRNHVHREPVVIPPLTVQNRFDDLIQPLWQRRSAAGAQSRTLAELRDALLPRLLSGELRVKDAEKIAEAVT
jgi:type I restriction enzyme, S subunit